MVWWNKIRGGSTQGRGWQLLYALSCSSRALSDSLLFVGYCWICRRLCLTLPEQPVALGSESIMLTQGFHCQFIPIFGIGQLGSEHHTLLCHLAQQNDLGAPLCIILHKHFSFPVEEENLEHLLYIMLFANMAKNFEINFEALRNKAACCQEEKKNIWCVSSGISFTK